MIWDDVLILLWHPHPFPTAQNRLNRTYLRSYRINLPWCVYHLTHTQHSNNLIILYPLDRLFQLQSPFSSKQFHLLSRSFSADNLFIYSNHLQQKSLSICKACTSFIHPALCHPRKMSLSSSTILYPKLSRRDSFFAHPSFSSVILYTAWKMRLSSPTNFDPKFSRKYRFWEGVLGWFIGQ